MQQARQNLSSEVELRRREQDLEYLRGQAKRSDDLSRKHQVDLKKECGKSRELNDRLVKAESRANELQRKYDESKKNYMRIREERDRLKGELE